MLKEGETEIKPHSNDVLCGRGIPIREFPGNKQFRSFVAEQKSNYVFATKAEKPSFADALWQRIQELNPPGRFLKQDGKTGKWEIIPQKKSFAKIRQAFREGANEMIVKRQQEETEELGESDFDYNNTPDDSMNDNFAPTKGSRATRTPRRRRRIANRGSIGINRGSNHSNESVSRATSVRSAVTRRKVGSISNGSHGDSNPQFGTSRRQFKTVSEHSYFLTHRQPCTENISQINSAASPLHQPLHAELSRLPQFEDEGNQMNHRRDTHNAYFSNLADTYFSASNEEDEEEEELRQQVISDRPFFQQNSIPYEFAHTFSTSQSTDYLLGNTHFNQPLQHDPQESVNEQYEESMNNNNATVAMDRKLSPTDTRSEQNITLFDADINDEVMPLEEIEKLLQSPGLS